jgi:hypothetical protein
MTSVNVLLARCFVCLFAKNMCDKLLEQRINAIFSETGRERKTQIWKKWLNNDK